MFNYSLSLLCHILSHLYISSTPVLLDILLWKSQHNWFDFNYFPWVCSFQKFRVLLRYRPVDTPKLLARLVCLCYSRERAFFPLLFYFLIRNQTGILSCRRQCCLGLLFDLRLEWGWVWGVEICSFWKSFWLLVNSLQRKKLNLTVFGFKFEKVMRLKFLLVHILGVL